MLINPSFIARIPDTIAMPVMVGFLISLRHRHPKLDIRSWLAALTFLFLSQAAWLMHVPAPERLTFLLATELLAGLAFASYRGNAVSYRNFDLSYLLTNSVLPLTLVCSYGSGVQSRGWYVSVLVAGLLVLGVSTLWRRQDVQRAAWGAAGLLVLGACLWVRQYELVAYCVLAAVYAFAAVNYHQRLAPKSAGKVAMMTSMVLLAAYYAIHPWIPPHPNMVLMADELANLPKFFVSVGMLLVVVENQSARHQYLALHDQLTGIPNRRMLDTALRDEIEWAQRTTKGLTLVMLDLNGFKQVNDTHGHLAGDHVLQEVAKRLRAHLRDSELLARMGGDEFVVLTRSSVTEEQVKALETALRDEIREPIEWDGKRLWIDGSMGAARFPEDVARWSDDVTRETPEKVAGAMLRIADMRMYAQKPSSKAGLAELETLFPPRSLLQ